MSEETVTPPRSQGKGQQSTERMVEQAALLVFGVLRAGAVVQIATSAIYLWLKSQMPTASWVMAAIVVLWSIGWYIAVIRRGSFTASPVWWGAIDYLMAIAALIVTGIVLPRNLLVGTWHAWAYAFAAIVAPTIPAWLRSLPRCVILGVGMSVVYFVTVLPGNGDVAITVIVNSLTFIIFSAASAIPCTTARRLAKVADEDRRRATQLSAQLEQARYRFHIHNATGLLAQLSRDDTPAELLPSLRMQALEESNRLRHDVLVPNSNSDDTKTAATLERVALSSVSDFGHLPIEVRTTLGRGVVLTDDEAMVVQAALISLLYNVQFHAHASEIVVHADCVDDTWEVSVCDDGVGFDPQTTPFGFGLQSQVLDSTRDHGMTVEITSSPGRGTCAVIRGRQHRDE